MPHARIGIAQWLATPGRPDVNTATALEHIGALAARGCDLIILPEMWVCGYQWSTLARDVQEAAEPLAGERGTVLAEASRRHGVWLAAGSVPERDGDRIYNTLALYDRAGEMRGWHRKAHLYESLAEHTVFTPGNAITTVPTDEWGTIGLSICFDGDFPEVARAMALSGARVVINVSAYEIAARSWWNRLYPAHALSNGQWWLMANQCGTHEADTLMGQSMVISPSGDIIEQAPSAAAGETPAPYDLVADVDLAAAVGVADETQASLWQGRRPDLYASLTRDMRSMRPA